MNKLNDSILDAAARGLKSAGERITEAVRSGLDGEEALKESIVSETEENGGTLTLKIGSRLPEAVEREFGSEDRAPQPFLHNALRNGQKRIIDEIAGYVSAGLR